MSLLLFAIILWAYCSRKYTTFTTLFLFLCFEGMGFIPSKWMLVKGLDVAFFLMLLIHLINFCRYKDYLKYGPLAKWVLLYCFFLLFSSLFSYFILDLSILSIIQGSRDLYLVSSYFFLIRIPKECAYKTIKNLFVLTSIACFLYVLQVPFNRPILAYYKETAAIDAATGLPRFYNFPILYPLCLYITCFTNMVSKKYKIVLSALFIMTCVCTLGRFALVSVMLIMVYGFYKKGNVKKNIMIAVCVLIMAIPFSTTVSQTFSSRGGGGSDVEFLLNSDIDKFSMAQNNDATFAYRMAWCYERLSYMFNQGLGNALFGIGLVGDQDPVVYQRYKFRLGLINAATGKRTLIKTPDIAYGNLIARLGILGMFIWLFIYWKIHAIFKLQEKDFFLCFAFEMFLLEFLLEALVSSYASEAYCFFTFFIALALIYGKDYGQNQHNNGLLQRV